MLKPIGTAQRKLFELTRRKEMKGGKHLLLDVVVSEGAAVLQLLSCKNEALLIGGNPLLVLDLRLDVVDGVVGLNLQKIKTRVGGCGQTPLSLCRQEWTKIPACPPAAIAAHLVAQRQQFSLLHAKKKSNAAPQPPG